MINSGIDLEVPEEENGLLALVSEHRVQICAHDHKEILNEIMDMQHQLDLMSKQLSDKDDQLFQKVNQLKLANDRIVQLQNDNTYRKEVVRLEGFIEKKEIEIKTLNEQVESKDNKFNVLNEKNILLASENKSLKDAITEKENDIESLKKELKDISHSIGVLEENKIFLMDENSPEKPSKGRQVGIFCH